MEKVFVNSQGKVLATEGEALKVTASVDSNIIPSNIKKDVNILGVTGTYEGSGGSSIINFTINNVSYQADSGMEWYDWVSSSYNTGGYICDGYDSNSYVRSTYGGTTILYKNTSERPWNLIKSGRSYLYVISGGSND